MTNAMMTPVQAGQCFDEYFKTPKVVDELGAALMQSTVPLSKFAAAVRVEAMRQPKLALAIYQSPETLFTALSVCASLGLLAGAEHKLFYLIPRLNRNRNRAEVTFIIGYHGMMQVAYSNSRVHFADAYVAFDGEPFSYKPASQEVDHEWDPVMRTNSLDNVRCAYAVCRLTTPNGQQVDATPVIRVVSKDEILDARNRSEGWRAFQQGKIRSTPWQTDPIAMARKTALRRLLGGGAIPMSPTVNMALHAEDLEEERLNAVGRAETSRRGADGMAEVLGTANRDDATAEELTAERARELLNAALDRGEIDDDIEPDMLTDEDVIRTAQALL